MNNKLNVILGLLTVSPESDIKQSNQVKRPVSALIVALEDSNVLKNRVPAKHEHADVSI